MDKPVLLRSNYLYLFGLLLLVCGLPVSFFVTSISQFVLAASFFIEGNFIEKFKRYFKNKPALIITGILALHVIGMLWTNDYAEGWKDIRIKLPLLILPVIMGGSEPLSRKHFHLVLGFFIASVFTGTLISLAVLTGIIYREITDIRQIFIFHVSHIRFALFMCIAIFSLLYFVFSGKYKLSLLLKIIFIAVAVWLLAFLVIMESVTGIMIVITISVVLLFYKAFNSKNVFLKTGLIITALLIPAMLYWYIDSVSKEYYSRKDITIDQNARTANGNPYFFDLFNSQRENGYKVWIYVNENEMRTAWNARSSFQYDSLDQRGQHLRLTLVRFLTSKGSRKDGEAVKLLSNEEVTSIEKGVANVNYQRKSDLKARIYKIVWEYDYYVREGDLNGHSVLQRVEFWKAACGIIMEHPFIGVGTGDMKEAYSKKYIDMNSRLDLEHRLRAHNQFLAIAVAFGLAGLLYFLFALVAPMVIAKKQQDYFYMVFFVTAILSMITEDTLETQTGVTFFAFFSCLFLFRETYNGK